MTRRSEFDRRQAVARLYDEACAAIDKERWQEAVEKLDRVRDIDPDFPGAEYRQRYAHKWYRIAELLEMGQSHMRSGRWSDALRCFRQIRREAGEYKNVALLQRICERQLIPRPPVDNRRPFALATTAVAVGLILAAIAFEAPDFVVSVEPSILAFLETAVPSITIDLTPTETTAESTPTTPTPADETGTAPLTEATHATPRDTQIPHSTAQVTQRLGTTSTPRPTFTPRPPTRTPTRFVSLPISTRPPATSTALPPAGSTATHTPAATANATAIPADTPEATATPGVTQEATATPGIRPSATATPGVTLVATRTSEPSTQTPIPTIFVTFLTEPPTPTPSSTATPVPPTSTATRTPTPVPPPTATHTPAPPATATPVLQTVSLFITADEYSFAPAGALAQSGAPIKLTLSNQGTVRHSWVLKDGSNNTLQKLSAAPGQNPSLEFPAPPAGVYSFICDIADYAQLGMTGKLTVR